MNNFEKIEWLKKRLKEPLPGRSAHNKMIGRVLNVPHAIPEHVKLSAVLCLLFPQDNELYVTLMKRKEDEKHHSGQVSFPGGRHEKTDANLLATALREAEEEIGIESNKVEVVGALTPVYIMVSNFQVILLLDL